MEKTETASVDSLSRPLAQYAGVLSDRLPGWSFLAAAGGGKPTDPPAAKGHDVEGGRLQSPVVELDKAAGEGAYYELRFAARSVGHGYWWVDFFDREGRPLPDCNSAMETGLFRDYEELFLAPPAAVTAQFAFVTAKGVEARDLSARRISADAAARWCDRVYAGLRPLDFTPPPDALTWIPRTVAALRDGTPFTVVLLGDSIANDMYTSGFQALVQRDFPRSRFRYILSVRGSTGCRFYAEPAQFEAYVARYRPDLLMIGGISNGYAPEDVAALGSVIAQARAAGMEVLLASPPHSREWRADDRPARLAEDAALASTMPLRERTLQRELAATQKVAFFDLTNPCAEYIGTSGQPPGYFNRDAVHNNNRGKQIIARILSAYFRSLPRACP